MKKILTGLCLILCIFSFTSCQNEVKSPSNIDLIKINRYVKKYNPADVYHATENKTAKYEIDDDIVTMDYKKDEVEITTYTWKNYVVVADPSNKDESKRLLVNGNAPTEEEQKMLTEMGLKLDGKAPIEFNCETIEYGLDFTLTIKRNSNKSMANSSINFKGKKYSYTIDETYLRQADDEILDSIAINGVPLSEAQINEHTALLDLIHSTF